jgi:hypothetical protein
MRALVAATCLSIIAAIGYYFWSEHQAWQEREPARVEIKQKQKKQAEETAFNKFTEICDMNMRNMNDVFTRRVRNKVRFSPMEDKIEIDKMLSIGERCIPHYKIGEWSTSVLEEWLLRLKNGDEIHESRR